MKKILSKKIQDIMGQMTLQEKASLCSGQDFWRLKGIDRLGIPSIMVTDGPHGLRKQSTAGDHLGLNKSVPATCFPTASATASSWDRELMGQIGVALGEECLAEDVQVLLGPGVNIKRSPLCGRNFEYISEDPYLTGELAVPLIKGIQSMGVGTSIKHFAVNNQEYRRMTTDSVVDERTLREIYLAGFEKAIKTAQPMTVMCAYNKVDGIYCSDNQRLLTGILKEEWGHQGIVMTDWGACNDRVEALKAGMALEMPGSGGVNDKKIVEAVENGKLPVKVLDQTVEKLLNLIFETHSARQPQLQYQSAAHHQLAKRAAAESAVLLKNTNDILPLDSKHRVLFVGEFFTKPRYQGSGSSLINPSNLRCAKDRMHELGYAYDYVSGYSVKTDQPQSHLIEETVAAAKKATVVVIFAGLTDDYESEGFDRTHLNLPDSHNALIEQILNVNQQVVVVLQNGAPVLMPWLNRVSGLLEAYLGGQAGGEALVDLLYGLQNPSGKLAETFPISLESCTASQYFGMGPHAVEYREGLYVGYRDYDTFGKDVLFPFGYGLSYTQFKYGDLVLSREAVNCNQTLTVSLPITNTGKRSGAEIVQLYVHDKDATIHRPDQELKGFDKVWLAQGETKTITFTLDKRSFAYYHVDQADWHVETGQFEIRIGRSSREIVRRATVYVNSSESKVAVPDLRAAAPEYYRRHLGHLMVSDVSFKHLIRRVLPSNVPIRKGAYTINSTLGDIKHTFFGGLLHRKATENFMKMVKEIGDDESLVRMMKATIEEMPLRSFVLMTGGSFDFETMDLLLCAINGKPLGAISLIGKRIKKKLFFE